jgi:cytochrome P450/NADPH-cytochrome P450 reductase
MEYEPVPGPRGLPIVGNILDLRDEEAALCAFERLADTYGPIFQLTINGNRLVVVAGAEMMK